MNKVIKILFGYIEIIFSYIIPKSEKIWMFLPTHNHNISGNIGFLFHYIEEKDPEIKCYFITERLKVFQAEEKYRDQIVYKFSLRGLYVILRAKLIIADGGTPYHKGRFNVIQLWHGTGFKNILALSGYFSEKENKERLKNVCFVPATSDIDRKRKVESFLTEKVYITGLPRNDIFFGEKEKVRKKLISTLGLQDYNKIICYAPTFRRYAELKPFSKEFYRKLQSFLEENNTVFLIKKHPKDRDFRVPDEFPNILDVSSFKNIDTQEFLILTDVLISDYSGIVSDFLLLDRPVIFYTYDFDEYTENDRSLYYDLKNVFPGPFATSQEELLDLIENPSWFAEPEYTEKYKAFQSFFHHYKDGNSSKRVYEHIKSLIEEKKL